MKISFNTPILPQNIEKHNGYGYATDRMLESLERLGYEVSVNDPKADVGICFNQPHHWKFYGGQYRIGYHPWESTQLKKGWPELMNQTEEVWTPSPLIANWYTEFAGIDVPVHVYEHGVDDVWQPRKRVVEDKFRFFHCGAEAARKGGTDTMRAFRKAFPNNTDVELNLKIISKGWNIGQIRRINIINGSITLPALVNMYHYNHVYVYPSWGEGFGLTPIQAMATGMPTITVGKWAPYERFIDPKLNVSSKFTKSPWPVLHPGNMLQPSEDDLIDAMRYTYENYDEAHLNALNRVDDLKSYYDWDALTQKAFSDLANRLK